MLVAGAASALLAMVCRISAANPKFTAKKQAAEAIIERADRLREFFLAARATDEAAYEAVVAAQKLPKDDPARASVLESALERAAAVPLELAARVLEALRLAGEALDIENTNLVTDVGCAAEFAHAAFTACAYNVRINHKYMKNATTVAAQAAALSKLTQQAHAELEPVRARVHRALP